MNKIRKHLSTLALAVSTLAIAPSAQAVNFVFTDTTPGGMSYAQLAAFQSAADFWSSRLTDNVTINLSISFFNSGNTGILGSTGSNDVIVDYSSVRSALVGDAKTALDASAVANLQSGPTLSFMSTNMDGTSRFNNDTSSAACAFDGTGGTCDSDNRYLIVNTANAKALGLSTADNLYGNDFDGTIEFNGYYASEFDFDRTDGIAAGREDFIAVATHEIGHALGFVSGVDIADFCINYCFAPGDKYGLESYVNYQPLDLFRYSGAGLLDFQTGGSPYFSVDGGLTQLDQFATGTYTGDGWQASHFTPDAANLMRPYIGTGYQQDATASDLAAFDAIGWDLAAPVPEPSTYAMMLAGLAAIGWTSHRRRSRRNR